MPSSSSTSRIDWLDGWRAIAVLLVIGSHICHHYQLPFFIPGKFGVFIFFSISGYIVTRLLLREREQTGAIDVPAFYLRRAARILPPLLIYVGASLLIGQGSIGGALRAISFSCNIAAGAGDCAWIFGHTWSLAFEEQYYLLLPLVLIGRNRWLFALAIPLAVAPFVFPVHFVGRIGFIQIYLLLGLGATIAASEDLASRYLAKVPVLVSVLLIILAGGWEFLAPSRIQVATGLLVPIAVGIGIFSLPIQSSAIRSILSSGSMRTIGLYSYSLYLWQQLATSSPALIPLPLGLLGAFGIAAVSFHTIERWPRTWAKRYSTVNIG